MKDAKRRSIFPSNPSVPFVLDAFKWHADGYTSLTHKRESTGFIGNIVQELCESRGGRPGLSVLTSLLVSVDVKNY